MGILQPYLNFDGKTEEAFNFYKSVFGGDFMGPMHKMSDMPDSEQIPENERNRVMHVSLPIGEHSVLMGSDTMPSMGHTFQAGNNVQLSLHPTSREEADRLFNGLSAGGKVEMPMQDTFWGAYYGAFEDKFGVKWMVNCQVNPS